MAVTSLFENHPSAIIAQLAAKPKALQWRCFLMRSMAGGSVRADGRAALSRFGGLPAGEVRRDVLETAG
jgi:hypothetical protein